MGRSHVPLLILGPMRTLFLLIGLFMLIDAFAGGPFRPIMIPEIGNTHRTVIEKQENTRLVGSLLAITLGPFGAHRLYLGTNAKVAVIYGLTFGGFGVLPLIDLAHLLFSRDLSPYRNDTNVFMWNDGVTPP